MSEREQRSDHASDNAGAERHIPRGTDEHAGDSSSGDNAAKDSKEAKPPRERDERSDSRLAE